eukprot:6199042-Pleurochrysis_carterae.AAC.4
MNARSCCARRDRTKVLSRLQSRHGVLLAALRSVLHFALACAHARGAEREKKVRPCKIQLSDSPVALIGVCALSTASVRQRGPHVGYPTKRQSRTQLLRIFNAATNFSCAWHRMKVNLLSALHQSLALLQHVEGARHAALQKGGLALSKRARARAAQQRRKLLRAERLRAIPAAARAMRRGVHAKVKLAAAAARPPRERHLQRPRRQKIGGLRGCADSGQRKRSPTCSSTGDQECKHGQISAAVDLAAARKITRKGGALRTAG